MNDLNYLLIKFVFKISDFRFHTGACAWQHETNIDAAVMQAVAHPHNKREC